MNSEPEENVGRLIKSAMGDEAKPRHEAEQRVLSRLMAEQKAMSEPADFPAGILGALIWMLVMVALFVAWRVYTVGLPAITSTPLAIAMGLVCLNLAAVPLAGIVIVIRRRACLQA